MQSSCDFYFNGPFFLKIEILAKRPIWGRWVLKGQSALPFKDIAWLQALIECQARNLFLGKTKSCTKLNIIIVGMRFKSSFSYCNKPEIGEVTHDLL